jgi:hypothetical protein
MTLTEENVLAHDTLELSYKWEHQERPEIVQVWYERESDKFVVKLDQYPAYRFIHFGGVVSWLGDLSKREDWE